MTEQEFELFKQLAIKFEAHFKDPLHVNIEVVDDVFSLTDSVDSLADLQDYLELN